MKVLHIFDFDDTLVKSDARVIVNTAAGDQLLLSSEEYSKYKKKEGDSFDYSDFDRHIENPKLIEDVFSELQIALNSPGDKAVILTARANTAPVKLFVDSLGLDIEVFGTGTDDPRAKAVYIMEMLQDEQFELVRVFEDNVKNIRQIKKFLKDDGTVALQTNRVLNGRIITT